MNPFFSIIVPCCDVAPYLRECLDSVVKQPFSDWECIIGVEESKDNTEEIAREYVSKDSRFKMFTGPRTGSCSASRNTGIDMATGEYVIFLDGDDTIAEGSLQRLHDKIAERPEADIYPCAMKVYSGQTGESQGVWDNYSPLVVDEMSGAVATLRSGRDSIYYPYYPYLQMTIFQRGFLVRNNLKCIYGLKMQDAEFSPRALYFAKRVLPIHEPFYLYRNNRVGSISADAWSQNNRLGDWAVIFKSLMAFHASVSRTDDFDRRLTEFWCSRWFRLLITKFFTINVVRYIPRAERVVALKQMFDNGFDNFKILLSGSGAHRRMLGWWLRLFVLHSSLRWLIDFLFAVDLRLGEIKCRMQHAK